MWHLSLMLHMLTLLHPKPFVAFTVLHRKHYDCMLQSLIKYNHLQYIYNTDYRLLYFIVIFNMIILHFPAFSALDGRGIDSCFSSQHSHFYCLIFTPTICLLCTLKKTNCSLAVFRKLSDNFLLFVCVGKCCPFYFTAVVF